MSPEPQNPLFVPLAGWAYDLFASGAKTTEFRLYGPRWNERTCTPGRAVVLSRGYGRAHRMNGVIQSLALLDSPPDPDAWFRAFGRSLAPGERVAAIQFDLQPVTRKSPMIEKP